MGWKISLIVIDNPNNSVDDKSILNAIGKQDFVFTREEMLEDCFYPRDNSINIGYYKGNTIISDSYLISEHSLEKAKDLYLTEYEQNLCKLFPNSEIILAACHSVVNYHGYALIKNGKKLRLKVISSDIPLFELSKRIKEEEAIYAKSIIKDGEQVWEDEIDNDFYTEDQLMEDFTIGVLQRRLSFDFDSLEDDFFELKMRKYNRLKLFKRIWKRFFN